MNQTQLHLLRQGAKAWNSQRPTRKSKTRQEAYDRYCEGIEAFNPSADEPMMFEPFVSLYLTQPEIVDLIGADLRGMDLQHYDLSESHLTEAKLNGADLRCANLSESDLTGANLTGADLRGANLKQANLNGAFWCGVIVEQKSLNAAGVEIPLWQQKDLSSAFTGLDSLSLDEWGAIVHFYGMCCAYCSGPYEIMDHFLPRSQGGTTWVGNVVPACFACWSAKGDHRRPDDKILPPEVMKRLASDLQQRVNWVKLRSPAILIKDELDGLEDV